MTRFPPESFDVILFFGVFYHLKDPLRGIANLRNLLRPGGRLLIEGEAFLDRKNATATFYYRDSLAGDHSNWWVPTLRCLREWVECSFFEIQTEHFGGASMGPPRPWFRSSTPVRRRVALTATAVQRADPRYKCPDPLLRSFDHNVYP
jgi:tRNA (mo5U34)-methyltransferase